MRLFTNQRRSGLGHSCGAFSSELASWLAIFLFVSKITRKVLAADAESSNVRRIACKENCENKF